MCALHVQHAFEVDCMGVWECNIFKYNHVSLILKSELIGIDVNWNVKFLLIF